MKQSVIALSSTESKYVALSKAGREATWLRNLYNELGFPQNAPTIIRGDNKGAVILMHNPQFHQRTKHVAIRHHGVQDLVHDNILQIKNCCDPKQMADILTKGLVKPKHWWHKDETGIQPITTQ